MSANSSVVLAQSFNTSNISFSPVRVLDSGGKQAYINYNGGMFVMQTPACALPYGMSAFDKAGPIKYSVELSLRGYDEAGKVKQFYDAFSALDEFMIDQGVKNSKQWFKADLNREVVKAFYTPSVRFGVDKEGNRKPYPPTVKLSLKQRNGEFETKLYDDRKQPYQGIPFQELLVKGATVTALIQCTGVWFAGSKYGLSWKATQIRIDNLPQNARGFTFVDDGEEVSAPAPSRRAPAPAPVEDEEEEEEDEAFRKPVAKPSVVAAVAPARQEEEEEDADDAEPIPVPKKPATIVKKKIVAKK